MYSVVSISPENRSIAQFHVTSRVWPENYEQLRFNQGHLFIKTEKLVMHIYRQAVSHKGILRANIPCGNTSNAVL